MVADGPACEILADPSGLCARGVRPLELSVAFAGRTPGRPPLTIEEGLELWHSLNLCLDSSAYQALREQEEADKRKYGPPVLEVKDLSYGYSEGPPVLSRVSLSIRKGEFVALVGQNGSGKTTLAKHFNGLLLPTSGEVQVDGGIPRRQDWIA